jgi:hypothetical protein
VWNRALRIAAAAMLCGGAVLIVATLATIGWSPQHGPHWNLLMIWRWGQREVVIAIALTTLAALVVLITSRLAWTGLPREQP